MGTVYYRSKKGLNRFLEDHGPEGVAIVTDQPSRLIRGTILVLFGLLLAAGAWSFIGKSDVVVESTGMVKPELEQQGVYLPIKGELVNLYVTEGMPIEKGDVVARINSPSAIELAGQATQAAVQLAAAERGYESFPNKRKAMEKEIEALKAKMAADERDNEWRVAESVKKLAEEQQIKPSAYWTSTSACSSCRATAVCRRIKWRRSAAYCVRRHSITSSRKASSVSSRSR